MASVATERPRIITLDTIRGIAVMGIFSVNVVGFALIQAAYFNPPAYGGHTGASLAVWATNMIVIDGKMRTLFSMLFGASMLLVVERAEAAAASGWRTHWRRMIVLVGFGLAHYWLIWSGDILLLYGISGLIAYCFHRFSPRTLILVGCVLLAVHMLLFAGFLYFEYLADIAAHAPGASQESINKWNRGLGAQYPTAAQIQKGLALRLGNWVDLVSRKVMRWQTLVFQNLMFVPATVGLMLIGMASYRSGFLIGEWSDARYRQIVVTAIPLGALAGLGVVTYDVTSRFYIIGTSAAFVVLATPFFTIMALGYAALIALATRNNGWLAQRIAAVGRCAISNYIGTSLVATFVFDGWGLGLYGSLSRWQAWLLVPIVWLMMLGWSKPWLERYHYGPLEWLWRSLARGSVQPMRKKELLPAV